MFILEDSSNIVYRVEPTHWVPGVQSPSRDMVRPKWKRTRKCGLFVILAWRERDSNWIST